MTIAAPAFVAWILLFVVLPANLPVANDQNSYLGEAAALKAGHGFRFEQYIGLPPVGMYPPGFSIWLAAFWKPGEPVAGNMRRLEVANWIAAGCALLALGANLFESEIPAGVGSVLLLLLMTSVSFTQLTVWLLPDVLFAAGSYALALLVTAYDPDRSSSRWWLWAGLFAVVLCVVKAVAIAYVVGLGAYGLVKGDLRRLSRLAYFGLPGCAALAGLLLRKGVPTNATVVQISAFGGWGPLLRNMLNQAGLYGSGRWLVEALLSGMDRLSTAQEFRAHSGWMQVAVLLFGVIFFGVPIAAGVVRSWKQPRVQMVLYVLGAYFFLLLLWPYYDGARFGIPLIAFVVPLLWRGLRFRTARAAFGVVLALSVPVNIWLSYRIIRIQEREAPGQLAELEEAAAWINATGGTGARVAAGRDVPLTHFYEYLGRRMLANAGPNSASNYLDVFPEEQGDQRADYVLIDESLYPAGAPEKLFVIERRLGRWTIAAPRR